MVREGPVVIPASGLDRSRTRCARHVITSRHALGVALILSLTATALAQPPGKDAPLAAVAAAQPAPASPATVPIDRLPYRIRVMLATEPEARLDDRSRDELVAGWLTLVRRFIGAPWQVEVVGDNRAASLVLGDEIESIEAGPIEAYAGDVDKVWLVRVAGAGSGLVFSGREYDAATRRLGPLQRLGAPVVRDGPRVLFRFSLDLFAPYAVLGERFARDVNLIVRGGSLDPASPIGRVVAEGAVFQPFRIVPRKDGPALARDIPYTFLRVETAEPPGARCSFVSVYGDPFTNRVVQKTALVALGVKPGKSPTRLRFLTLPDRAPAAGYVLTARKFPDGTPRELGLTDREGRIELAPGFADSLVVVRLLAGSEEPMIEFPMVPGESPDERVVPAFDAKPLTVALEARLDSLRDTVIDLVAVRARLLARLKARFDGEDWAGAGEALKEHAALASRESFEIELKRLKDEAARQQAKTKSAVLTKTAQARFADLQALVERYLDDEEFKAYADALDKLRTEAPKKAVATPKGASRPAPASVAPSAAPSTPEPVRPAPAPAPPKPAGKPKSSGAVPF